MSTVVIPVNRLVRTGTVNPEGTTGSNLEFTGNDGNVILQVVNETGSDYTLTAYPSATFGGNDLAPLVITIPSSSEVFTRPFPPAIFGYTVELVDSSGGELSIVALGI